MELITWLYCQFTCLWCYCSMMLLFCCFCFPVFLGRMLVQVYPAFVSCWHVLFRSHYCLLVRVARCVSNKFELIWFDIQSWPEDALQAVATRFLDEVELSEQVRDGCIEMCKQFHTSSQQLSQRYHLELERHNYVTPTSYLELISTFKMLLDNKRRWTLLSS